MYDAASGQDQVRDQNFGSSLQTRLPLKGFPVNEEVSMEATA